ncbi:MAG: hypothetical protein PHD51_03860 [Patescibacteria group bacterium]|nr:hypothetical protein [Patescibacteria group bacterium]MDD5490893.1 hypothetical protein [Patescibacteria group bacterium]
MGKIYPINIVALHKEPHVDDAGAYLLAKEHGGKIFPGIETAKIEFLGERFNNGDELLKTGTLCLGIGRGRFDDHAPENKGETASSLMAMFLGIENEKGVKNFLRYTHNVDSRANGDSFDLANMLKVYWQAYANMPLSPEERREKEMMVFDWAAAAIIAKLENPEMPKGFHVKKLLKQCQQEAEKEKLDITPSDYIDIEKYVEQIDKGQRIRPWGLAVLAEIITQKTGDQQWFYDAVLVKIRDRIYYRYQLGEFDRKAKIFQITAPNGQQIRIATLNDDGAYHNKIFRNENGGKCDILIQKTSAGNVQIYTNSRSKNKLPIKTVIAIIRSVELEKKKIDSRRFPMPYLEKYGEIDEIPIWFYSERGEMLLNGSLTADKPATTLTLEQLLQIVKFAFEPDRLPKECWRSKKCSEPSCILSVLRMEFCSNLRRFASQNNPRRDKQPTPTGRKPQHLNPRPEEIKTPPTKEQPR